MINTLFKIVMIILISKVKLSLLFSRSNNTNKIISFQILVIAINSLINIVIYLINLIMLRFNMKTKIIIRVQIQKLNRKIYGEIKNYLKTKLLMKVRI